MTAILTGSSLSLEHASVEFDLSSQETIVADGTIPRGGTIYMAKHLTLLEQILRGGGDANISFSEMLGLLKRLGFQERIKGSHHIFSRQGVDEILNLQADGNKCKPYQVKQVRKVIINYGLAGQADD